MHVKIQADDCSGICKGENHAAVTEACLLPIRKVDEHFMDDRFGQFF